MAFKKLTPLTNADGERRFADAGTVEGEKKAMFVCECGGKVVWVKSAKSGKNYLANCSPYGDRSGDLETYWYAAYSPHFKTCDDQATQRTEMIASYDASVSKPDEDDAPW